MTKKILIALLLLAFITFLYIYIPEKIMNSFSSYRADYRVCFGAPSQENIDDVKLLTYFQKLPYHSVAALSQQSSFWNKTHLVLLPRTQKLPGYFGEEIDRSYQEYIAAQDSDSLKRVLKSAYFVFGSSNMDTLSARPYWLWIKDQQKIKDFCDCWKPYRIYMNESGKDLNSGVLSHCETHYK